VSYPVENAVFQWEDGYRKLEGARSEPALYRTLGRTVLAVQDELRKRLGSTFSVEELARVYQEDGIWGLEVALEATPEEGELWDTSAVIDAAFYLYMREAADFAGGSLRQVR
jgi:hypothetical protein